MCGSFPLQNHAQRWWDFTMILNKQVKQEQNKTKILKKNCMRKRKQYRLRFDWKSLENCILYRRTLHTA